MCIKNVFGEQLCINLKFTQVFLGDISVFQALWIDKDLS